MRRSSRAGWVPALLALLPCARALRLAPCGVLTADTVLDDREEYMLGCQLYVPAGLTLNISAGTTIVALEQGNAPAIIIERGGVIHAIGTLERPITLTAINPFASANASVSTDSRAAEHVVMGKRGKWGGLVVLGRAPINAASGVNQIEALRGPLYGGADPGYGGTDPDDASGSLRYVRIWHAGAVVSEDEEINGLTLAGVGAGTLVDHVEVSYSLDDGVELFGGTVRLRREHARGARC